MFVIIIIGCRRKLLESVNHFVHLNLAFTLLAAFVVFLLGIELGNRTTVSQHTTTNSYG